MELDGTQCYCWGLAHNGGATHVVGFSSQGVLKPSHAIACSLQRKPIPPSFVRDCSAWPAIGCGRPWKRTTRRHQLIALCGAGGFSPHAARLERARELVLCGTQIDLLRAGWAIDSRLVHRVRPRLLDGLGCDPQPCAHGRDCRGPVATRQVKRAVGNDKAGGGVPQTSWRLAMGVSLCQLRTNVSTTPNSV